MPAEHPTPPSALSTPQRGLTVWFTGLSGAGKTTISQAVAKELQARGDRVTCLDGDVLRQTISADLGFSPADRVEHTRRIGAIAQELTAAGWIVLVAVIAPYRHTRQTLRTQIGAFVEIYVNAPLAVCEQRDVKGLYRRARAGEVLSLTGIHAPYEAPLQPDLVCYSAQETIDESVAKVITFLTQYRD
jgi:adenylylsulfate kinase